VKSPDYWAVHFDLHENVKLAFDAQGISIPYPQRDVHLFQAST
jgi:small conductance mechanosensitive channel